MIIIVQIHQRSLTSTAGLILLTIMLHQMVICGCDGDNIQKESKLDSCESLMSKIDSLEGRIAVLESDLNRYPRPDYDSGWFPMKSQHNVLSYREVFHDLNGIPSNVKVLIRVPDKPNVHGEMSGMIFEGVGAQQNDDDTANKNYGGVMFGYDKRRVKLWAPNKNNNHKGGAIVTIGDGWGRGDTWRIHEADVKVLAWK